MFGKGFNFSEDGPGNRLVYHLSGCNMHCPWCSNPDGMDGKAGKDYTANEILLEAISCKPMFFSGGGVTFTGGEASLWHAELLTLLRELRRAGVHTAIETNGTSPYLPSLVEEVDYLIMDFKHYDGEALFAATGVGVDGVKQNLESICQSGRQAHIRIPLINGFNTEDPKGFAAYLSLHAHENVVFELLPYHEYGKGKWKTPYTVKNGFVSEETLARFERTFEKCGLKLIRT